MKTFLQSLARNYPNTVHKLPWEALCWQTDKEHRGTDFPNGLSQHHSLDFIHIVQVRPETSKPQVPWSGVKLEPAIPISISCNRNLCWNCCIVVLPEVRGCQEKILRDTIMHVPTLAHWAHLCREPGSFFWVTKHWMSAFQDGILCMQMTAQAKCQNSHFIWLIENETSSVQTKICYPLERSHHRR